jgi:hypothetical protein
MNLYLYIPPASAYPAGCIKGTVYVYSLVRQYYDQNTSHHDFVHFVRLLYRRLLLQGWEQCLMRELILEACTSAKSNVQLSLKAFKTRRTASSSTLNSMLKTKCFVLVIH